MANEFWKYQNAVDSIKIAIQQSQALSAKSVNQKQLAWYYILVNLTHPSSNIIY